MANAAALAFDFEYDTALLSFDAADDNGDGVPDALALIIGAGGLMLDKSIFLPVLTR